MIDPNQVIVGAIVTEKAERLRTDSHKYTFRVSREANKIDIRRAIEKLFKVHVADVHVMNQLGKMRRMGRYQGRRPDWKKAIVTVKKGESIEALER